MVNVCRHSLENGQINVDIVMNGGANLERAVLGQEKDERAAND